MPITLSGFVIPIPLMLQVCFFKSLLWQKTSHRLLIFLLAFLTFVVILTLVLLLLILLWENLVGVDVKLVVKSTNEHPYHRAVCSYSNADWDGLRDDLRHVPWLDIFTNDATYVAKEITGWVEIGIDYCIPRRKFQLKPHSAPSCAAAIAHRNNYFLQYHRNATPENKKLFYDSRNHCKKEARSN